MIGKLSALKVAREKRPGDYGDGGGLYLQVTKQGSKSWIFRFWVAERDPKTLLFWRQKIRGFGLQNSDAGASRERERASLALPRRSRLLLPACGEKDGLRGPLRDSELTGNVMAVQR
jgi:hypothetical protein